MDPQKQLYGLMAVADEQQKAVAAALDGLAKERAALAQAAAQIAAQATAVTQAAANTAPKLQKAAGGAVDEALRVGLLNLSETAVAALDEASRPLLGRMSMATKAASEASETLADSLGGFRQRLTRVVVSLSAGAVAVVGLSAWGMVAWQRHQVESLQQERQALTGEVEQLRANVAALAKKGGRIKLESCGPADRLCVEIASNQGTWHDESGSRRFAVPKGY